MSFMDKLQQERRVRGGAIRQDPTSEFAAKRRAEEESQRLEEQYQRLRPIACRYLAESGCLAYIQAIVDKLRATPGLTDISGDWSPPRADAPLSSPMVNFEELYGSIVRYIRWRYRGYQETKWGSPGEGYRTIYHTCSVHIRIEMRPDGILLIAGKKAWTLPLAEWKRNSHLIDSAFQHAFDRPNSLMAEERAYHSDSDDHGIGL